MRQALGLVAPAASRKETAVQIEGIASRGQLVAFNFMQDAVAASQTDVQLPIIEDGATSGTTGIDGYCVPFDGEIVAIAYSLSAAGSAGTLTIGPTVDGTEKTALTQTVTTGQEGRAVVKRGSIPVAAGEQIGVEITSDGSWNGTSADLAVQVYVLLTMEGI